MSPSNDLFDLIKSLTKQEKRYFKLFVSKYNTHNNNYLKLFDAIGLQKLYDEKAIHDKFKKEVFVRQLHATKYYLAKLILKSLSSFHSSISIDTQLKESLKHIEILYEKGLFKQLKILLRQAKKQAYQYELFIPLLEIIRWERTIMGAEGFKAFSEKEISGLQEEEKIVLKKILNVSDYWNLSANVTVAGRKYGTPRNKTELKKIQQYLHSSLLKSEKDALSYDAKYFYHVAHSSYYHFIGDKAHYKHGEKLIGLIESRPDISYKNVSNLIFAINNLILAQLQSNKHEEALKNIFKLRHLKTRSIANQAKIFRSSYSHELHIYLAKGEFEKGYAILKEVENGLERYKNMISYNFKFLIYYNCAYTCFGINNYSKAIGWLNNIINDTTYKDREDIQCFARILSLIIHFERKNSGLLKYSIKSTYRYLLKKNKLFKIENIVLNFIRNGNKIKNNEQFTHAFKSVKKELISISKDPFEKTAFEYFDFISWIDSKLTGKSFTECVKGK